MFTCEFIFMPCVFQFHQFHFQFSLSHNHLISVSVVQQSSKPECGWVYVRYMGHWHRWPVFWSFIFSDSSRTSLTQNEEDEKGCGGTPKRVEEVILLIIDNSSAVSLISLLIYLFVDLQHCMTNYASCELTIRFMILSSSNDTLTGSWFCSRL